MTSAKPINVILDTRVLPRTHGGLATATMGLVDALGKLEGPEIYHLIVENEEELAWLSPHRGANQRIVDKRIWLEANRPQPKPLSRPRQIFDRMLRPAVNVIDRVHRRLHIEAAKSTPAPWPQLELSDGFFESLGCDMIHFTWQRYILTALPSIYTPHDLQHLHFPEFFTAQELARREVVYPAGCRLARTVIAGTQWIKDDIVSQYAVDPSKVQIIPWASPSLAYGEPPSNQLSEVQTKYKLDRPFALYPAAAWPHKNHIRLLEAIAHLRDTKNILIQLVCTGSTANSFWLHHWPKIEKRIQDLNLSDQVKFLGFVPEGDMRALYRLAQFLVFPSLFEADSCPIHEAWVEGTPVASSNHTALPDQVGEAGVLFDADDVPAIADAMYRLATDANLRQTLSERGRRRVKDFDWTRTAKAYRAVYRRTARQSLNDEDRWLLQWDWMREPGKIPPAQSPDA